MTVPTPSPAPVNARDKRAMDEVQSRADDSQKRRRGRWRLLIVAAVGAVLLNGGPWLLVALDAANGNNAALCACWVVSAAGFGLAQLIGVQGGDALIVGFVLSPLLDIGVGYAAGRPFRSRWGILASCLAMMALHALNFLVAISWFRANWYTD